MAERQGAGDHIPDVAVRRLPVYLRVLEKLYREGTAIVSSAELSRLTGFSSEQIRKDLTYFGAFGTRGVGYSAVALISQIRRILGLDQSIRAAVFGAGNLGQALVRYHAGKPQDVPIREGEMWLLPGNVPHSPQRPEPGSVGLVVERVRPEGVREKFQWYCFECHNLVHEVELQVRDIVADLPPLFNAFYEDRQARTCSNCGALHPGKG